MAKHKADETREDFADELRRQGWSNLGDSDIEPWEIGREERGRFVEIRDVHTKFGVSKLASIETDAGELVTFGAPAILERRLMRAGLGREVYIKCVGKVATASGEAWDFLVLAAPVRDSKSIR